jgi:hypothetical protein
VSNNNNFSNTVASEWAANNPTKLPTARPSTDTLSKLHKYFDAQRCQMRLVINWQNDLNVAWPLRLCIKNGNTCMSGWP